MNRVSCVAAGALLISLTACTTDKPQEPSGVQPAPAGQEQVRTPEPGASVQEQAPTAPVPQVEPAPTPEPTPVVPSPSGGGEPTTPAAALERAPETTGTETVATVSETTPTVDGGPAVAQVKTAHSELTRAVTALQQNEAAPVDMQNLRNVMRQSLAAAEQSVPDSNPRKSIITDSLVEAQDLLDTAESQSSAAGRAGILRKAAESLEQAERELNRDGQASTP